MSLKTKDLFNGRVVYIAHPGAPVGVMKVVGTCHVFKGIATDPKKRHLAKWEKCVLLRGDVYQDMYVSDRDLNGSASDLRILPKLKQAQRWCSLRDGPYGIKVRRSLRAILNEPVMFELKLREEPVSIGSHRHI